MVTPGPPQTPGVIAKWASNANYPFGSLIVDSNNNVQMALYNGVDRRHRQPAQLADEVGALTASSTMPFWRMVLKPFASMVMS